MWQEHENPWHLAIKERFSIQTKFMLMYVDSIICNIKMK